MFIEAKVMEVVLTTTAIGRASSSQIITTNKPTPNFLQAGCASYRPSNSVKALKGKISHSMDLLTPNSSGVFQLWLWPLSGNLNYEISVTATWGHCHTLQQYNTVISAALSEVCTLLCATLVTQVFLPIYRLLFNCPTWRNTHFRFFRSLKINGTAPISK